MWNIIQEVNYVELRGQGFQFNLSIDKIHFGVTIAIARTCMRMAPPVPYVEDRSSSEYICNLPFGQTYQLLRKG